MKTIKTFELYWNGGPGLAGFARHLPVLAEIRGEDISAWGGYQSKSAVSLMRLTDCSCKVVCVYRIGKLMPIAIFPERQICVLHLPLAGDPANGGSVRVAEFLFNFFG